jgi:tripartite-type tricarboxylate transporter receptor subunit TctC
MRVRLELPSCGNRNSSLTPITQLPVKAGRLRGLGITSARRASILPECRQSPRPGYPGYEATGWLGMLFAANTPFHIVERAFRETLAVLNDPATREQIEASGLATAPSKSPDAFHAHMKSEAVKWAKVVKAAGIKPE